MSRKHAELERELIADLVPRTGRTLVQWMAAIDAAGLSEKNAIIDWLRPQGMTFAHASWLERIHNNGGRPIYIDVIDPPGGISPLKQTADPGVDATAPVTPVAVVAPAPAPSAASPKEPTGARSAAAPRLIESVGVAELLARGKGLRPLADMLIREAHLALPGLQVVTAGELLSFQRPAEIAVLQVTPRELRLGLDLGALPFNGPLTRARLPGAAPRIGHMIVLNDARQIDGALLGLLAQADARANGDTASSA